jgi:hypothetical protein
VNGCFCTQDQPVTFTDAQLGKVSPLLAEAYRDIKQLMASGAHAGPLAGNHATMSSSDEELLSKSNLSNCVKDVSGAADSSSTPGVRLSLSQKQVARPASAVVDTVSTTAMGGMKKSQSSLHGRGASARGKLACSVSTAPLQAKQNAVQATRDARRDHHPHSMEHAERAVRNALRAQHPQRGDWTRRKAYDDLLRKRRLRCSSKACPAIAGQHSGHRSADTQPTELVATKDCWLPSDVRACEGLLLTSPCIASSQQEEHSSRPLGTVTSQGECNGLLSMPSCIASSQQDGYSSKPLRTVTSQQEQAGGLPSKPSECISDVVQNTLMVQNLSEIDGTKKWQPATDGGGEAMHGGGSTGESGCLRNGNNHQNHKGAVKGDGGSQDCIGTAWAGAPHSASPLCQSMSKCTSPVHGEISEGQRFRPRNPDILSDESVCEDDISAQMMPFPESSAEQQEHIWQLQKCTGESKCPQSGPFHCTEDLQDASASHAQARVLNAHALEVVDSVTGCFRVSNALAQRTSVPSDCSKGGQKVFTDPSPGTFTDGVRNVECHSQFERYSCCPELQSQISMYQQHYKNSTARLGAQAICALSPATGGHGCSDLGSCLGTTLTGSGTPGYGQEAFTEGTCATATHAAQDSFGMFAHPCLPPAGGDALAAVPSPDVSTRTIQGVDCSSDVVKPAQMDGENVAVSATLGEDLAAGPTFGESAAMRPTIEKTAATSTTAENAVTTPALGDNSDATPALGENAPGSSTPEANADATCAIKEHDSASPALEENANVNLTLGEAVDASPAHRENDAAVLKTGQSAAASPASGAEAAATCEIGQDAGANLVLGENAQVNPTLGCSADDTPALRESAAAAPKNGQSAAAAPTNGLISAALPTLGENAAASLTLGRNAAALLTSGEKAAITPELAESGDAKPTFGEIAVANPASGENVSATPTLAAIVSTTSTSGEIAAASPTSGENAAATPTSGENAAATPKYGENAAATPTLVAIVSSTPISGEIIAATPTYGENTTATPAFTVVAAAIPTPGENGAATPTSGEIAAATSMLIEIVSATPTHGENAVATPTPGENAVATPTRGENVSDNSTSGENVSENPTPGENAAAALVPGRHGVGGKGYGCIERKGHISSAQGHLHEIPRSAVGKLTFNLRSNNELHRVAPVTGTGDSAHGKNQRSRDIQMGLCKRTDACKDNVQSGAAIIAEAAAAVRDNVVAAKWNEFQKAMLKRAKRLGSRGLQSGRGA